MKKYSIVSFFIIHALFAQAATPEKKDLVMPVPSTTYAYHIKQNDTRSFSLAKLFLIPCVLTSMLYLAQNTIKQDIQEHPYLACLIGIGLIHYGIDTVASLHHLYKRQQVIKQVEAILHALIIACGIKNELQAQNFLYEEDIFQGLTKNISYSLYDLEKIIMHNKELFDQEDTLYFQSSNSDTTASEKVHIIQSRAICAFEVFQACKNDVKLHSLLTQFYANPTAYYHDVIDYLAYTIQQALIQLKKHNALY